MVLAMVPAMCPSSVPVLCRCPDRRLGLRYRGRRRSPNHSGESPRKLARFVTFCFTPTPASDQHHCRRLLGPPGFPQGAGALRGVAPPLRLSMHAGGKPHTPHNLHNTAGPARRPDDHDKTTSRRTSQLSPYPCRRLCPFLCPPLTTPAPERPSPHSRPCLFMFRDEAGAGHAGPSSPDRRGRRRAQIRTQSRSEPRTSQSDTNHRFTAPEVASGRRKGPGRRQVFKNDHDVASWGHRRQMYCACSCTCFCDRVCPTRYDSDIEVNAAQPTRVLFLKCVGNCNCACPLRAPAARPAIDAGQGPATIGLRRMSTRPTDHSGLRRSNVRAVRKRNPPLTPPASLRASCGVLDNENVAGHR